MHEPGSSERANGRIGERRCVVECRRPREVGRTTEKVLFDQGLQQGFDEASSRGISGLGGAVCTTSGAPGSSPAGGGAVCTSSTAVGARQCAARSVGAAEVPTRTARGQRGAALLITYAAAGTDLI